MNSQKGSQYFRKKLKEGISKSKEDLASAESDPEQNKVSEFEKSSKHLHLSTESKLELHIRGLNFRSSAKQVTEYLETVLVENGFPKSGIESFELARFFDNATSSQNPKTSRGYGFITVTSKEVYSFLMNASTNKLLAMHGKSLKCLHSTRSRSNMDYKLSFSSNKIPNISLQVGNVINATSNQLMVQHHFVPNTPGEKMPELRLVSRKQKLFEILFPYKSEHYKISVSLNKLGFIRFRRERYSQNLVMMFMIYSLPILYKFNSEREEGFVYSKSEDPFNNIESWVRCLDPTSSQAIKLDIFKRCKVYRLVVNKAEETDFLQLMQNLGFVDSNLGDFPLEESMPFVASTETMIECSMENTMCSLNKLSFNARYLLECLISVGKIDLVSNAVVELHNGLRKDKSLEEFVDWLQSYSIEILETCIIQLLNDKYVSYLNLQEVRAYFEEIIDSNVILPSFLVQTQHAIYTRRAYITPLQTVVCPPERDLGNRVLEDYKDFIHRFLRVNFVDETLSTKKSFSAELYEKRISDVVQNGLNLAGRCFVFLGYSNSQLREHSCWFYDDASNHELDPPAPPHLPHLPRRPTAEEIRQSIGDLSAIKEAGKYGARLGQGFSTYMHSVESISNAQVIEITDIERNKYCFSDGVGLISDDFAREIAFEMKMNYIPSAFQIRLGGIKGLLCVEKLDPDKTNSESKSEPWFVKIRPSMKKFSSDHNGLYVLSIAKPIPMYLNRQLIPLLTHLGVKDNVIIKLLDQMVSTITGAFQSNESALGLIDSFQQTSTEFESLQYHHSKMKDGLRMVADCLLVGFDLHKDRLIQDILMALCRRLLLDICLRARIFVPNAICLFGVVDYTNTLKENEVFAQFRDFSNPENIKKLVEVDVIVGRNPSLHPGDLRKLRAVDNPLLKDMVDVIVFSSQGDRPQPNKMSGGDLDGDIYFIIYDQEMVSPLREVDPMSFEAEETPLLASFNSLISLIAKEIAAPNKADVVTVHQIQKFFVNFMRNDNLGAIATAHLVHADKCGPMSEKCLRLARLHSKAVDFPKTGDPAVMDGDLRYNEAPDFMENIAKPSYKSENVLGRIYRKTKGISEKFKTKLKFNENIESENFVIDSRLCIPGSDVYFKEAEYLLDEYNFRLWQIMSQYDVHNEGEVMSGFIYKLARRINHEKEQDITTRISLAIRNLRKDFHDKFWDEFIQAFHLQSESAATPSIERTKVFLSDLPIELHNMALSKASAWYQVAYMHASEEGITLVSFGYIVHYILCEILARNPKKL